MQKMPKRCPICGKTTDRAAVIQASQVSAEWLEPVNVHCRAGAWLHFTSPKTEENVVVFVQGWHAPPEKQPRLPGIISVARRRP